MGAADVLAKKRAGGAFPRLRTLAQGLTLGFGDEIEAAVRNPGVLLGLEGSQQGYQDVLDDARSAVSNFREQYPTGAFGIEAAGSLIPNLAALAFPVLAPATTARNVGLLGRMGQGAVMGGAEAGLYSLGTDNRPMLERRPSLSQTAAGFTLGGLFPGVAQVVGQNLPQFRNPLSRAQRGFETMLDDANMTVDDLVAARNFDKPQVAADLMGRSAQGRVGALAGLPGPQMDTIADALRDRQAGQIDRAIGDLETTTQIPLRDTSKLVDEITKNRSRQAAPLYEAAYEAGEVIDDPQILALVNKPEFQDAYVEGKRIYDAENSTRILRGEAPLPELSDLPDGAVSFNLRGLDNIYRGMRDNADQAFRQGQAQVGRALRDQANALRDRLDTLVPEYGQARNVFKSNSEMLEALDAGKKFMTGGRVNARTIRDDLAGLDEGQRELYRIGAIDAVRQEIYRGAREGTNIQSRFFGTRDKLDRLRLLFPEGEAGDQQFNQLINRLQQENQMQATLATTQGARTGDLIAQQQAQLATEGALNITAADLRRGLKDTMIDRTAGAGLARLQGSPRVRRESAELLMDPVASLDTQGMPVVSPRMADFQRLLQDSTQRANRLQGLLSRSNLPLSGASGLLGGMMAPR